VFNVTGDKVGYLSPNSRFVYVFAWRHQGGYLIKRVLNRAKINEQFFSKVNKKNSFSLQKMIETDKKSSKLNFILIFKVGFNSNKSFKDRGTV
jgi:hypothetical protein